VLWCGNIVLALHQVIQPEFITLVLLVIDAAVKACAVPDSVDFLVARIFDLVAEFCPDVRRDLFIEIELDLKFISRISFGIVPLFTHIHIAHFRLQALTIRKPELAHFFLQYNIKH